VPFSELDHLAGLDFYLGLDTGIPSTDDTPVRFRHFGCLAEFLIWFLEDRVNFAALKMSISLPLFIACCSN